jgi:RES domain-containing protein
MPERRFARALSQISPHRFEGDLFRQQGPQYLPLSGDGARIAGGRWNPPDSYPVIYTATTSETCWAELKRHASNQGLAVADLMPRVLVRYEAKLDRLLDLTDEATANDLGVSLAVLRDDDLRICQAVGEMAHHLGFEGVMAPSATGIGVAVAVFINRLAPSSTFIVAQVSDVIQDLSAVTDIP